jgi:hypothetical protein
MPWRKWQAVHAGLLLELDFAGLARFRVGFAIPKANVEWTRALSLGRIRVK